MAAPTVTYTFVTNTTISSANVNQNFSDIIAALTDGTKTLTISALTCSTLTSPAISGATTFSSTVTINNQVTVSSINAKTLTSSDGSTTYPMVLSEAPATNALKIVRGTIGSMSTSISGEGYTCARNATGNYTITFNNAFYEAPVVTAFPLGNSAPYIGNIVSSGLLTSSSCKIQWADASARQQDTVFCFIAIGQRG